jgi:glucose-1-phosphate cytidylyltransferase
MKAVILAGGFGVRIQEETVQKPKPMVEIGDMPILEHIMNIYGHWGHKEFIVCLGYKGYIIKEYFLNYYYHTHDFTVDLYNKIVDSLCDYVPPWRVTLADTGELTETGGRIKRILPYLKKDDMFLMTYGDGLTNVNINKLIEFHNKHGKLATVLAVKAPSKFGSLQVESSGKVKDFTEKSIDGSYINGGFFVLNSEIFNYIKDDNTSWEFDSLPELVKDHELMAYKYDGFWKCMDSLKDMEELRKMWNENKAPWKIW